MRRFRRPAVTVSKRRVILFRLFLVFCAAFAVFPYWTTVCVR